MCTCINSVRVEVWSSEAKPRREARSEPTDRVTHIFYIKTKTGHRITVSGLLNAAYVVMHLFRNKRSLNSLEETLKEKKKKRIIDLCHLISIPLKYISIQKQQPQPKSLIKPAAKAF